MRALLLALPALVPQGSTKKSSMPVGTLWIISTPPPWFDLYVPSFAIPTSFSLTDSAYFRHCS